MIVGQIIFGSTIRLAPKATIKSEVLELSLGVWKTLGLEIVLEPLDMPTPCFDIDEMRRRDASVAKRRRQ